MSKTIENKQVFRAELHVHTPSSNCYRGEKNDDEYIKIIETAYKNKIDILAITDHNSVRGYYKICSLEQKLRAEYTALSSINDSKEAKSKIKQLKQVISAFESLLLLPGVEFEVNNGVHLLIIFNPETPESVIERFLFDGGYDEKTFGQESDVFSNWSIFDLFKESKNYDCVVIDAHSDSNKGIFNTLQGQTRLHAFIDPSLRGICYKSEKQKVNIEHLLSQYGRKTPISFLKSSDAHQTTEIGRDTSYFRLEKKSWSYFKEAFNNPTECISTTFPQTFSILKKSCELGRLPIH